MRVLFFGSSEYCIPILETLNKNFKLVAIITKKNQTVEKLAQKLNIPAFTPQDKKELYTLANKIHIFKPDISVVSDYGLIIPAEIFDIPKYKTLNIHFSRLPDLRGASPVQYTILRGDDKAWITIQLLDQGLDTGDIIWQKPFDYTQGKEGKNETADSLYKKLFNIASAELPDIISKYVHNELKPQKQNHSKATYSKILTREDGFIPFKLIKDALKGSTTSIKLERSIRAYTPWPGVWTEITLRHLGWCAKHSSEVEESGIIYKKRLKILKAHLESIETIQDRKPNPIQDRKRLVPDLVQLEGKNPVTWKQFQEGYDFVTGKV